MMMDIYVVFCFQDTVEMVAMLLHRSLSMSVGSSNDEMHLNRHIAAVGTRFKLLSCGLLLLQGDVLTR